jgi:hypothetical protein
LFSTPTKHGLRSKAFLVIGYTSITQLLHSGFTAEAYMDFLW